MVVTIYVGEFDSRVGSSIPQDTPYIGENPAKAGLTLSERKYHAWKSVSKA